MIKIDFKAWIGGIACFLICFLVSFSVLAQPVIPTDKLSSRRKNSKNVVNLPYKPLPKELLESDLLQLNDFLPEVKKAVVVKEEPKKFDWSSIPFIPSKRPKLQPAGDPPIL